MTLTKYAIIVAGGSGRRMQSSVPKQFMPIGNQPVLMHTIRRFRAFAPELSIILVLPSDHFATWQQLCQTCDFHEPVTLVAGGESRFQSVGNGLSIIPESEGIVAIHDGVRPFVSVATIRQSFEVAAAHGSAIAAVPLKDSIRQLDVHGNTQSVDRTQFRVMQTPQTFRLSWLRQSFLADEQPGFTDDASVVESAGFLITLIEGSYQNIKITTAEDLLWAEAWLRNTGSER